MIPKAYSNYFKACSKAQQQIIIVELLQLTMQNEEGENEPKKCPHCKSESIRGNGKLKGMPRYVCLSCKKNFSKTSGKFWFALKKGDKVNKYIYCLLSGYSIRLSASETGISIQTSFDWRHKLLKSIGSALPKVFNGAVKV